MTKTKKIAICAIVAALYAGLTIAMSPISYGPLQIRFSEALCVLPFAAPYTSVGLFLGCVIANIMTGNIFDIVFGSLATLLAAFLTSKSKSKWVACAWPVVVNALIVGAVIAFAYTGKNDMKLFLIYALQIASSEAVVVYILGLPLLGWIEKRGLL